MAAVQARGENGDGESGGGAASQGEGKESKGLPGFCPVLRAGLPFGDRD